MSWLSKLGNWAGEKAGTIAKIALPIAAIGASFIPGVGAGVSKFISGIGNKVSEVTGIGDGKPGVFGIGDGLPGIFGIGTGKGAAARAQEDIDQIEALKVKVQAGDALTAQQQAVLAVQAKNAATSDMKKEGINPLILLGGAILGLFALRK